MQEGVKMKQFKLLVILFVLFLSTSLFAQTWTLQTGHSVTTQDFNSAWAVDANICWMCGTVSASSNNAIVIKTTNGGTNWTTVVGDMPVSSLGLYTISATSDQNCWVGAGDGSVYHTTNGGTNWSLVIMPTPATSFVDVIHFFNANTGFILGDPAGTTWGYYWTTNGGANWTSAGPSFSGSEAGWNNSYAALDTGHIWFGTNNTKIYKGGLHGGFTSSATTNLNSFGVAFMNATTGVATFTNSSNAVLSNNTTTNGGTTWTSGFTPAGSQLAVKCILGTPYVWTAGAGASGGAIYFSSNYGVNWTLQNSPTYSVNALTFANANTGWAGTSTHNIYKWQGNLNVVNTNGNTVPDNFKLEQNYPNPFNPTTNINFSIPKASFVTLKVYNSTGQEVMTLINDEYKAASNYTVSANLSSLSSGVYYYTIRTADYTATKKMMLVK